MQPSGAVLVQWVPEQTLRAELVQESAEAFLTGNVERSEDRKVFTLLGNVSWITTDMRVTHAERTPTGSCHGSCRLDQAGAWSCTA